MSKEITESLLEMHFHAEVVNAFKQIYGSDFIKMLKPSQQDEAWIGFDQGWIRTTLSHKDLTDQIRRAVKNHSTSINNFYLGYFMQYKAVQQCLRRSKYCPTTYKTPYYRSELSLVKNPNTSISQHATLRRLVRIKNAFVYYVCPMVFSPDEIFNKPDVDKLQIIPIDTSPNGWRSIGFI